LSQPAEFLSLLFADALAEGLGFGLFALPSKDTGFFRDIPEALAWINRRIETDNLYARIGFLKDDPKGRGEAKDTVGIPALWVDVDLWQEDSKKPYPKTEAEALEAIREAGPPPSLVIHTGHGIQCYWMLREPWLFSDAADRTRAETLLRRWEATVRACLQKKGYTCDSVHDLARVLRIPGTKNLKREPFKDVLRRKLEWN
jgi:hypothetical protein